MPGAEDGEEGDVRDSRSGERGGPDVYRQINTAYPGGSLYVVQRGDMHIRNGHPVYRVEPFPASPPPLTADEAAARPSRLLAAECEVIGFTGRRDELAELAAWRDDEDRGLSVKLVHGPGGQGKTRLAARFAADSAEQGWTVWAAHHLSDPTSLTTVAPGESGPRLVVIVEYADRWPADDLQLLLGNAMLRHPERTRVLLVARPAGSWWPALRHRLRDKLRLDVAQPLELGPITADTTMRGQLVAAAREQFAAALGSALPDVRDPGPEAWEGPGFDLVLTLHMAALVAVHSRGRSSPANPAGLSAYLLDREHDYWQTLHDHDQIATPPLRMARTSYLATLTRPLGPEAAVTVLTQTGAATAQDAERTLSDHTVCYPPAEPDTLLEPLYPDRLGEDFVALQTAGHTLPDYLPDDWAAQAPARLLAPTGPESDSALPPSWSRPALTVLIETSMRWRHVAEGQLSPLLTAHPRLALAAGGASLARLTEIEGVDLTVLEAIEPHLPPTSVDLAPATAAIRRVLTADRLQRTDDPEERGTLHVHLASSLLLAGLPEQALPEITEATVVWRRLAQKNPAYQMALVQALRMRSATLSALGRHEEAVSVAESGVLIFQHMPQPVPSPYAKQYAQLLHTLGISLSELGRYERALAVTREATRLLQEIVEGAKTAGTEYLGSQESLLAGLADALTGLGNRLWRVGRRAEALAPAQEAVDIYRTLAEDEPDVYGPGLATALNNLAIRHRELGSHELGLAPAHEAVTIRRQHVRANRRTHLPALADNIDNLSIMFAGLGRRERARELAEEAVELYREAVGTNPAAHTPDLAIALNNLAIRLNELKRHEEALDRAQQSLDLFSDLVGTHPQAHLADMGNALLTMGGVLSGLGRHEEALARFHEAVGAFRHLAEASPEARLPDLAAALNNLGATLADLGHPEQAMGRVREALDALGLLPPTRLEAHLPLLERLLSHLGSLLYGDYGFEAAVPIAKDRVNLCRRLVEIDALSYEPRLAVALVDLGNVLGAVQDYAHSLAALQEGMELYARLHAEDPERDLSSTWLPPRREAGPGHN